MSLEIVIEKNRLTISYYFIFIKLQHEIVIIVYLYYIIHVYYKIACIYSLEAISGRLLYFHLGSWP